MYKIEISIEIIRFSFFHQNVTISIKTNRRDIILLPVSVILYIVFFVCFFVLVKLCRYCRQKYIQKECTEFLAVLLLFLVSIPGIQYREMLWSHTSNTLQVVIYRPMYSKIEKKLTVI